MMTTKEFLDAAEKYADEWGFDNAIAELGQLALIKAQHIRANWQGDDLAAQWERLADKLGKLSVSEDALRVSGR